MAKEGQDIIKYSVYCIQYMFIKCQLESRHSTISTSVRRKEKHFPLPSWVSWLGPAN